MVFANPAREFRLEIFRLGDYGGKRNRIIFRTGPYAPALAQRCLYRAHDHAP